MILFILFKNECICPKEMCHSEIRAMKHIWKPLEEHKPNKVSQQYGNLFPQSYSAASIEL